jgi:hypothetical protein
VLCCVCLDIRVLAVYPFSTKTQKSVNMNQCIGCKNKDSYDRCPSTAITGLAFCGRHVKSKTVRVWHIVNRLDEKIIKISKVWRGYAIRRLLKLAGAGVLNRSICHNDEELVSLEPKDRLYPLDYFSFEENGKVWWFDIRSIISCLNAALVPVNPYTRTPLTTDTRRRIREICRYRLQHRKPIYHNLPAKRSQQDLLDFHWLRICQILAENGFEDIHPNQFLSISRAQLYTLLVFVMRDMKALSFEHPNSSKRHRYYAVLKREHEQFYNFQFPMLHFASLFLMLLNDSVEPYNLCFILMSALHRL